MHQQMKVFNKIGSQEGQHSTEVAFALPTQPSQAQFSHLTAGKIEPKNLARRTCHSKI